MPCGSLGVTCSKSVTISVGSKKDQETLTLARDKRSSDRSDLKRLTVRKQGQLIIAESLDLGFSIHWDRTTRVHVKVDPRWKGKIKGLCGNYNDDQLDDFQTPSGGFTEVSTRLFADSWRLQPYCSEGVKIQVWKFFHTTFLIYKACFCRIHALKGPTEKPGP